MRRRAGLIATLAAGSGLAGCAAVPVGEVPADTDALVPKRIADGVYAFIGSTGEAAPANRGEVGNGGFIVGPGGTALINTGGSYRHGRRMLDAAERIGGRPVVLAIVTQPLQEFVMGSAALVERGIPIVAQADAAALIGQRCEHCLETLTRLLGADAMQGTRVLVPDRPVRGTQWLEAGGRRLRLVDAGWAQTPGDLAVLDESSGVLFAGGLVSNGRLPELRDAKPDGWRQALALLRTLAATRLVPGYGPPGTSAAIEPVDGYLVALQKEVEALLADGTSLSDAVRGAELPAYAGWAMYRVLQPRNVQQTYLRLEAQAFAR